MKHINRIGIDLSTLTGGINNSQKGKGLDHRYIVGII
jgi:hypothetical protein